MSDQLLIEDPKPCGIGEGAKCCAFLVMGMQGFECGRVDVGVMATVRARLAVGSFTAKYDPGDPVDVPFPQCQENRP